MNHYKAKFEREAKARPQDWVIIPSGSKFELVYLGAGKMNASLTVLEHKPGWYLSKGHVEDYRFAFFDRNRGALLGRTFAKMREIESKITAETYEAAKSKELNYDLSY